MYWISTRVTVYCLLKARASNNSTQNSSQGCVCNCACSFKTSYLYYCGSKRKIWQLSPYHKYSVLFLLVLGAAAQHFKGVVSPQVAYISLHPLRFCKHIDQTQGPICYSFLLMGKVPLFSLSSPLMFKLFLQKKKKSSHSMNKRMYPPQ